MKYEKDQKTTIFVVITTAFVTTFTGSALNLSIPDMGQHFNVSASFVGWLVTAYMLTVAALSVPFGRIADLTCRKRILVIGILIFSLSSTASVFGISMWMLIGLRILQGLGGAMIFSTNTAVLISAFPGKDRGKVLGYSIASTYVGLSAGPVIGGFLNHNFGWRSIFVLTAVIGYVVLVIAWSKLPKDSCESKGANYDILGNVLYIGMIVLTMYGLSDFGMELIPILLVACGLLLGVIFVRHELKMEDPVVQVRIFKSNIAYSFSNLAALLNYGATFAIGYLMSIYLQVVMGYSSQAAGFILIAQPALMAILSPYTGRLSDRISPFKLASFGMGLCAAGVLIFAFVGLHTPLWVIIGALVITGVGFAFFSSPNTNAVMACVEAKDYGVASSILATMRSIGHTSSMVIVTVIVSRYMGSQALADAPPELLIKTMHTAFLIFAVVCAVGVFISLKRKSDKKETEKGN
ncbi:MFS transporter [Anaerovorax odorimutans]|uniref:MFS transporter n=1 Tax=Anaerovorax odorimutans TaxID=109327 RepID=A0ABT1RK07_9FIRM|nr:MFS transporter [Anaerovorax odorimutans]MCQ4635513.1 MFS transporter [Anaerovorax odorimutans]